MSQRIRILLVDDHFVARMGLHSIVDSHAGMEIVADAHNGAEAIELYRQHQPDITIMDLRMPGLSGFQAITAIREEFPTARIVVLSNYEGSEDVYRALESGAMAYLLKSAVGAELIQAIESVHGGRKYLPPALSALMAARVPADRLTERELDVLRLLAKGHSNREIAAVLSIAENTVRIHVTRLLQKLSVEDRTQAVIVAVQRGIVHIT
ncbi:MAG: response regulator transcription factor [Candidatus Solibacter sp.]|nr:response regulator transcription factor [Candidatus Solibacter sp.]